MELPTIGDEGRVFALDQSLNLFGLDPSSGYALWQVKVTGSGQMQRLSMDDDLGNLYVVVGSTIAVYSPDTGHRAGVVATKCPQYASAVASTPDGMLYYACDDFSVGCACHSRMRCVFVCLFVCVCVCARAARHLALWL